ncbi:MAG TPA: ribonuclease G [Candidatus Aphodousia faecigallinarum]|uniref:Ribonuclease G n=1 Tax=Candidatus Aphodousia faecigallinarum TaxID=2840677 RepID=A0A9D1IGW1_9BURK|nr:ribonuclease G [Candidatus Aphodousia faecigallinarum]
MDEALLIHCSAQETRVALMVNGILEDLHIERRAQRGLVGNVYKGKVMRVLPGMQSAFVEIGLERTAFLHVHDIFTARKEDGSFKPIEYVLHEGESIIVQVAKDPIGTKGARLTTTISLAGHKLVYLPKEPHIGVSQRIDDEAERERLKALITDVRPETEKGGYIVRTCAEGATSDDFVTDMQYLARLWKQIDSKISTTAAPALLYQDLYLEERALRDMVNENTTRVIVDAWDDNIDRLKSFAQNFVPTVVDKLEMYSGETPLFEQYGIEQEIEKALSRRVELKSGGYLIFDQNEAMSTIDVNTGAYVGKRDFGDTVFKTNLEAARVIARQLRLRNLGGIIIIDFIDMEKDAHRAAVLAELQKAVSTDRVHITMSNFSELGLIEMTRKRTRDSLAHILCEPCPLCAGRGEIKTARTVCYEILREVLREWRQYPGIKEFSIIASQTVIDLFLEDEANALNLLQDFITCPVSLQVENCYSPEQYDITFN